MKGFASRRVAEVRNRLVAADVERADRDRVAGRGGDDIAIGLELFFFVGHVGMREIEILGAVEADAGGAHRRGGFDIGEAVDVGEELHRFAVGS